jgi:2-keto-4-pentenoate hydratase/2-oxohepta-3-ene-1,7-dioic acid hydratase in catechol pathway
VVKLVSYEDQGQLKHGRLVDDQTVMELGLGDLSPVVAGARADGAGPTRPLSEVSLRAPLNRPGKLLAVAANYQEHVAESGGARLNKERLAPRLFLKPPTAIAAPGASIALPSVSAQIDWEAELVVVIGATARNLSSETALDAVFGYTAGNDVSARSVDYGYERDESATVSFFDWLSGKWPDGFAPMGPCLVTADEIGDPQSLDISLTVNGAQKQSGSTAQMIFTVAELVAFASRLMTLEPGDVIFTGTPSGVGATTGEFLSAGDEMTVTISGIGALTNTMRAAD